MTRYDRIALTVIFAMTVIFILLLPRGEIKQDTSFEECQYLYNSKYSIEEMENNGCDIYAVEREVRKVRSGKY